MFILTLACLSMALVVRGNDPASSWLAYSSWTAPNDARITALNASWVVPSLPKNPAGSNAPGWWYGVQTSKGNGALVQPILAYGYEGNFYSIFNGVFDWTDGSWKPSRTIKVSPGDLIESYVVFDGVATNSYTMYIACKGQSVTTTYKLLPAQHLNESTAYFVLEHQPNSCSAYPTNGECTFTNISVTVDYVPVASPAWATAVEQPACNSLATVVDAATIKFTWNTKADATSATANDVVPSFSPAKWQQAAAEWLVAQRGN